MEGKAVPVIGSGIYRRFGACDGFGSPVCYRAMTRTHLPLAVLMLAAAASDAQRPERGRDLGIPFEGTTWVEESGFLWGPVMITNTHSVGVVRDAVIEWVVRRGRMLQDEWSLPVVAETWDGVFNDINGCHVTKQDAWAAMDSARGGRVVEGSVGGGTGMVCNQFKGGIGTASRRLDPQDGGYTVGVLVQCNYGRRRYLRIAGVPVGQEVSDLMPCRAPCGGPRSGTVAAIPADVGSIIIVVATDAPLLPHQLKRLARRGGLGVGRLGGVASNSSGDIFIAFSTANARASRDSGLAQVSMVSNEQITPLFEATVQATEEAIVNAMLAARTMIGADDLTVYALPHDRLRSTARSRSCGS